MSEPRQVAERLTDDEIAEDLKLAEAATGGRVSGLPWFSYVAHARTNYPRALAELQSLRQQVARLLAERERVAALVGKWRAEQPGRSTIGPLHAVGFSDGRKSAADELAAAALERALNPQPPTRPRAGG